MYFALNSKEMKDIDDYATGVIKIPALVLMERAAFGVVQVMKKQIQKQDRILAVCGSGNNGGDGIAAGRILFMEGYHVAILFIGEEQKATEQTKVQLNIAKNLGIPFENNNKLHEYNIIIDAVFGVGLSRPVTGLYEEVIKRINTNHNIVYSVDMPSGVSADSGKVMNIGVKADVTITFGYQKIGLLLYPGSVYAGRVIVEDIGFPQLAVTPVKPKVFYYDQEDLWKLPERKAYSNKGTYGKVLIIAGNLGMCGAAYLSAKAAYHSGAGLVKVLTSSDNRIILQTSLPEALFEAYDDEDYNSREWKERMIDIINWASVIVIGPGLGLNQLAETMLSIVIKNSQVPVIIDADGIQLLAKKLNQMGCLSMVERLDKLDCVLGENIILTPHLKELSILLKVSLEELVDNLVDTACQCSYNKMTYVIKDARTLVTHKHKIYINTSGNNGMATGGSGDVLTGILAAFVGQGMKSYEASCLGVYIHGLAGDYKAKEKGVYSLLAGDIIEGIENVIYKII